MMTFTARDAKNRFGEVLQESQRQAVMITRNGRPYAQVRGLEGQDAATQVDALVAQERSLLSYLGIAAPSQPELAPEDHIRLLRDEW